MLSATKEEFLYNIYKLLNLIMDPEVWGPHVWIFLHSVTLNYPIKPTDVDKQNIQNFFIVVPEILPCPKCREHFRGHYSKNPLTDEILSSKEKLVKWLISIHNSVNKMNGKPEMTYESFLKMYDEMYNRKPQCNDYMRIIYILIIILIIIMIPVIFALMKK